MNKWSNFLKSRLKVWVVTELYYPEETSTGYFLTHIAQGLAENYSVSVLCSQPTYSSRGRHVPDNETHNRVCIHRCWSTTFDKDKMRLRLANVVTITLSVFFNAMRRFNAGDSVIVVTNPPLLPFAVLFASFLKRAKCCLIIHDVYPEVLVATGYANARSATVRAVSKVTKLLYKCMANIIVLGRDMEALIQKKLNGMEKPIKIIPNWSDVNFIRPIDRLNHPMLVKLGIADKFVIQYSGNIGLTHGIEQLVMSAKRLMNHPTVHFLFIGFGGKKAWLEQQISKQYLNNITVLDYLPRNELPVSLTACDVSIISFNKGMTGVSVPSRLYNIMAAGKPIIAVANSESELSMVLKEEGIGWVIAPGDVDGLINVIQNASGDLRLLIKMGQRARKTAENKYTKKKVERAYKQMIESLYEN